VKQHKPAILFLVQGESSTGEGRAWGLGGGAAEECRVGAWTKGSSISSGGAHAASGRADGCQGYLEPACTYCLDPAE
jgi:hypothetical protein